MRSLTRADGGGATAAHLPSPCHIGRAQRTGDTRACLGVSTHLCAAADCAVEGASGKHGTVGRVGPRCGSDRGEAVGPSIFGHDFCAAPCGDFVPGEALALRALPPTTWAATVRADNHIRIMLAAADRYVWGFQRLAAHRSNSASPRTPFPVRIIRSRATRALALAHGGRVCRFALLDNAGKGRGRDGVFFASRQLRPTDLVPFDAAYLPQLDTSSRMVGPLSRRFVAAQRATECRYLFMRVCTSRRRTDAVLLDTAAAPCHHTLSAGKVCFRFSRTAFAWRLLGSSPSGEHPPTDYAPGPDAGRRRSAALAAPPLHAAHSSSTSAAGPASWRT